MPASCRRLHLYVISRAHEPRITQRLTQKSVDVQEALAQVMKERGHPCYLRSDNGSEFIEKSLQKWLKEKGVASISIELVFDRGLFLDPL